MFWFDGRKIFRWSSGTENLYSIRGSHQRQIQISDNYFYESESRAVLILFFAKLENQYLITQINNFR